MGVATERIQPRGGRLRVLLPGVADGTVGNDRHRHVDRSSRMPWKASTTTWRGSSKSGPQPTIRIARCRRTTSAASSRSPMRRDRTRRPASSSCCVSPIGTATPRSAIWRAPCAMISRSRERLDTDGATAVGWRPASGCPRALEAAPVPAILEYLPYRKRDFTRRRDETMHPWFAARGYACVRVDMRGSGDSDGILHDEYLAPGAGRCAGGDRLDRAASPGARARSA